MINFCATGALSVWATNGKGSIPAVPELCSHSSSRREFSSASLAVVPSVSGGGIVFAIVSKAVRCAVSLISCLHSVTFFEFVSRALFNAVVSAFLNSDYFSG